MINRLRAWALVALLFALPLPVIASGPSVVCEQGPAGRFSTGWNVKTSPTATKITSGPVSVSTTATLVQAANANVRVMSIQNEAITPVYCGFDNTVTVGTNYFVILKASAAAADGSGGQVALSQWNGTIYCIASSTSIVAVGAY